MGRALREWHFPVYVFRSRYGRVLILGRFSSVVFLGMGIFLGRLGFWRGRFFEHFLIIYVLLGEEYPVGPIGFSSAVPFRRLACFRGTQKGEMGDLTSATLLHYWVEFVKDWQYSACGFLVWWF